jgi:cytochrome c oxidase subunit 1
MGGMPRRIANPFQNYEFLEPMFVMNKAMTHGALLLGVSQLLLLGNFLFSMFKGRKAEQNPWEANTLEWNAAPNPPPHGNFGPTLPTVYRGPYEYSSPEHESDFLPQHLEVVPAAK